MTAFSMMTLPAVVEVIFRHSSMETPPESSVLSVRVTREMATLDRSLPKSGTRRIGPVHGPAARRRLPVIAEEEDRGRRCPGR